MSAPTESMPTLAEDPPFLRFPPFPSPPPDVTIMPFKNFKPRGIQLFSEAKKCSGAPGAEVADEEDAELDALGIPTVELRIKHATDECKSSSRKRRKKKKAAAAAAAAAAEAVVPIKKLSWYQEWEEGEDLRVTKVRYDSSISPVDRFFQSASDFRTGRPWPPVSSGLNNLWDQFRLFTGLLVNPSIFRKTTSKKYARADSPDFDSDDEDVGGRAFSAKRQRSGEGPAVDDEEAAFDDPHKLDEELREEKISVFLSDPEKAVRVFLSSYMREHGLIWSERNLIFVPHLVSFFLAFVLRNRVLPEPAYQRGLKRALEAIEWAKKELPLTYTVGQAIPDAFNEACRECFGRQGGINWSRVNATLITTEEKYSATATTVLTDVSNSTAIDVSLPTEAQKQMKDAIDDNVDMEDAMITPSTLPPIKEGPVDNNANGWGGDGWASNGWGNDDGSQNAWAQNGASWGTEPLDGEQGTWNDNSNGNGSDDILVLDTDKWGDANPSWSRDTPGRTLFSLLGPSTFPWTHTTGIIECSTRRVSSIHFPPDHPKATPSSATERVVADKATQGQGQGWAPSASGVEQELDARFAKVVLEPWGREEGDISGPEIWTTSRGPVVNPHRSASASLPRSRRRPHDPLRDAITLLVEPKFAETLALVPGLGLGAMWIEIARQKKNGADASVVPEMDEDTPGRFWYHEDVTGIFPSFYTTQGKEIDG